jgi:hypothetical protein
MSTPYILSQVEPTFSIVTFGLKETKNHKWIKHPITNVYILLCIFYNLLIFWIGSNWIILSLLGLQCHYNFFFQVQQLEFFFFFNHDFELINIKNNI